MLRGQKQSFIAALALALLALCIESAQAQSGAPQKAAAQALFDHGLELMRQDRYAEACAQLEQSQAIEPGTGTLMYLAECYEQVGRTASAWATYREAESAAREEGQMARSEWAAERAALVEPRLAKLAVEVDVVGQAPAPEMSIRLNGVTLNRQVWGVPVPVDPGDARIEVTASGYVTWTQVQLVAAGDTQLVRVPPLEPTPPRELAAIDSASTVTAKDRAVAALHAGAARVDHMDHMDHLDTDTDSTGWRVQRPVGIVLGATGLVALGVGTYFGLRAIGKDGDADALCPGELAACSSREGVRLSEQADSAAGMADVFLIGGAAALATGVVLYLTAPARSQTEIALSGTRGGARVTLQGAF